jgi:hypothetical protein
MQPSPFGAASTPQSPNCQPLCIWRTLGLLLGGTCLLSHFAVLHAPYLEENSTQKEQ